MSKKHAVTVDVTLFMPMEDAQTEDLRAAVQRYGEYLGLPAHPNVTVMPESCDDTGQRCVGG